MVYSLHNDRPVVTEESAYALNNSEFLGARSYAHFEGKGGSIPVICLPGCSRSYSSRPGNGQETSTEKDPCNTLVRFLPTNGYVLRTRPLVSMRDRTGIPKAALVLAIDRHLTRRACSG